MKINKKFHPALFGFSGFSGAGKTTLIEKLIKGQGHRRIGYIKHDAHKFEMDTPGKDTYRQYQAGASIVYINDPAHSCLQIKGEDYSLARESFKDCDLILVEGHKYADHPKFLFLDQEGVALKEYTEGKITEVIAFVLQNHDQSHPTDLPAFHRDDIGGIMAFIQERLDDIHKNIELQALILTGGKSSRMGTDKSLIHYHGIPQAQYLYNLCVSLELKTFISCNPDQVQRKSLNQLPMITDRFLDFGPMGGILSAMTQFRDKAWLVIACDLPLVSEESLRELVSERDPFKQATAYFNKERKHFEPLFAIYEPRVYSRMLHFLGEGMTCPQKVLFNSSIKTLELETQGPLLNANTPEDQAEVLKLLKVT